MCPNKPIIFNQRLGGSKNFTAINASGVWTPYFIPFIYQRCVGGVDTEGCTCFSFRDALQILGKFLGNIPDYSVSYNAVDSGTSPKVGNTYEAPVNALKEHWACLESERPFTPLVTTIEQFYLQLSAEQKQSAAEKKGMWDFDEDQLPDTTPASIAKGLKISPVRVGIDGNSYFRDTLGRIFMPQNPVYNHCVVITAIRPTDGAYEIFDSESMSVEYLAPDYVTQGGFIYQKKTMNNLYRKIGQSAIGLYVPDNGGILLFAVGNDINGVPVQGGSVFKAAGWQYSEAQLVNEWPYPIIGEFTSVAKIN